MISLDVYQVHRLLFILIDTTENNALYSYTLHCAVCIRYNRHVYRLIISYLILNVQFTITLYLFSRNVEYNINIDNVNQYRVPKLYN